VTEWNPDMDAAPRDGTPVEIKTQNGCQFAASFQSGFIDSSCNDTSVWCEVEEDTAPPCWTDGACWAVNENFVESSQPTHWRLPTPPEKETT